MVFDAFTFMGKESRFDLRAVLRSAASADMSVASVQGVAVRPVLPVVLEGEVAQPERLLELGRDDDTLLLDLLARRRIEQHRLADRVEPASRVVAGRQFELRQAAARRCRAQDLLRARAGLRRDGTARAELEEPGVDSLRNGSLFRLVGLSDQHGK